jgi:hypothetical protein
MTTTTARAPYRTIDILALRIDPKQTCSVVENQMPGDRHVHVLRIGKPAAERIRNEDVMLLGQRPIERAI